jgi:demethylmenaquinone methyltransferase/2-methoxy-6-polyprenyl-1,4-benzoquinol methylase
MELSWLPSNPVMQRLYLGYLYAQGAFWGMVLHGKPRVYTYIPDSLRSFVSIDDFSSLLRRTGYGRVNARKFILGGIGLHWAEKGSVVAEYHQIGERHHP